MSNPIQDNTTNFQKWAPVADGTTSIAAGAAICALEGASVVSPVGIGIAIAAGVNTISSALISKLIGSDDTLKTQFFKMCAQVAALGLSALALPHAAVALGAHAFFTLTLEVAVAVGIADIAIKIATFTAYKIGSWISGSFNFPKTADDIARLSKDQLKQVKEHFEAHPKQQQELPLRFQVALNRGLESAEETTLPVTAFAEVGANWTADELEYLQKQDATSLPTKEQKAVNTLFFENGIAPQTREYTSEVLPEIDPKGQLKASEAAWTHLHYTLHTSEEVPTEVAAQLQKWQLPPVRNEHVELQAPESPQAIAKLSSTDVKWHFNHLVAETKKWNQLSDRNKAALVARFVQEGLGVHRLPLGKEVVQSLPRHGFNKAYALAQGGYALAGRVSKNIPWKKVGAVALIALVLTGVGAPIAMLAMGGTNSAPTTTPETALAKPFGPELAPQAKLPGFRFTPMPTWMKVENPAAVNNSAALVPHHPISLVAGKALPQCTWADAPLTEPCQPLSALSAEQTAAEFWAAAEPAPVKKAPQPESRLVTTNYPTDYEVFLRAQLAQDRARA